LSFTPGSRVGPFEILGLLGAGGMGEVYHARDTRLGRDVAIKVLPAAVASDPERLARFDREARLLATLNHPHIATIHGVESSEGVRALVLELVDGPTLAERIARGPLPVAEAVRLAGQIAEALDAAHVKGVIHRDLKPANIKVTPEGQVKVLDFGLAKAFSVDTLDADLTQLPTVTAAGTRAGVVLGTAAYMSPEQARGHPVDKRTDIWAFGCVLYEMLTGKRPFSGETLSDTIAAILEREPDWSLLPGSVPPDVGRLVRRCLEKDVKRRLRDIGNTKIDLDESLTSSAPYPVPTRVRSKRPSALMMALLMGTVALVAILMVAWRFGSFGTSTARSVPPGPLTRFVERLPDGLQLAPAPAFALAPDGRRIAYVAIQNGIRTIYVRELDDPTPRALPGSQDADQPFFSPDGRWIGFFAEGKLKKIAVAGGAPVVLCDATIPRGGTWLPDNTIVFAPSPASVLLRIPAAGGTPKAVSTLDRQLNEASHRWPHVLPGGHAILYAAGPTVTAREWIEAHIVAQSLETSQRRQVAPHGTFPRFATSGHLLYVQSGIVYAQAFDPDRLDVAGDPFPILNRTTQGGGINGGSFEWTTSTSGLMAYVPGFDREAQLVLVDRAGTERVLQPTGAYYGGPRLSPDGRQVAVTLAGAVDSEVWIYDIVRGTRSPLTSGGRNLWPVWSPDGTQVAYASSRAGSTNVFWRRADGAGAEEQLTSSQHTSYAQSWSAHHSALVLSETDPQSSVHVALLPMQGNRKPTALPIEGSTLTASFSADGQWVAYVSNSSGRNEVYVRPYPGRGAALQVSTSGGEEPLWARQGHELFFRRGEAIMAVDLRPAGSRLVVGPAKPVLSGRYAAGGVRTGYDVSADGRTFLVLKLLQPRDNLSQFTVVMNWLDAVKQRATSDR
jgi:eukaryotic-like serine/threonine-protein kinase